MLNKSNNRKHFSQVYFLKGFMLVFALPNGDLSEKTKYLEQNILKHCLTLVK